MRVFFTGNQPFLEEQNGQVPRSSETPWFWLFLALPRWPSPRLTVLHERVDDEDLPR